MLAVKESMGRFLRYRKMLRFYSQFIKKGDLCFDVGAHKGNKTDIFLKLGAKVIAVEPQERCFEYLRERFAKEPRLALVKQGLADKEGELVLHICEGADAISTFSDKWKTGRFSNYKCNKNQLASVTVLDNLMKQFGLPVFCKIDVEGFEFQVLKGLSQSIPYLSFEFTREFFDDARSCINHLLSLGHVEFNCSLGESMRLLFHPWAAPEELCEELSSIDDELLWGDIYARFT